MKLLKYILIAFLLSYAGSAFAQNILSGKVTEIFDEQREAVIGANVSIVNKDNRTLGGTVTNLNGIYNLRIPENESDLTIVFSYIGMTSQRVKYTGQENLDILLEANVESLAEVVISGQRIDRNDLGISRKEQITATQKIKVDELIETLPVASIEDALQGQLSGVDIIMGGGDPGARSTIQIRGASTLNAASEPLIVINGIPYTTEIEDDFDFSTANNDDLGALLNIAPSDIEEIEVLKDAAATAIWGTKGANGVLMIKTKRGSEGKTRFNFNSKFSAIVEPSGIPMLNGNEYVALMQEAIWNSALYRGLSFSADRLKLLFDTPEIGYDPNWRYFNEYNQDTDWMDEVKRTALSWDNNFSMSGGGEKATYRFALGYLTDQSSTIGIDMDRFNASLNIDYDFSTKLRFSADFTFAQTDNDNNWGNVRSEAFSKMPNKSPYWIDPETGNRTSQYFTHQTSAFEGEFEGKKDKEKNYNPVAMAKESINKSTARESKINFKINYKILPELIYDAYVAMAIKTSNNRGFLPQVATGVVWTNDYANQSSDASSDNLTLSTRNTLNYMKNWNGKHNLVATALFLTSQTQSSNYASKTSGNASAELGDPIMGSKVVEIGSSDSETRRYQATGLLNYTLLDKYVFQGVVNVEGNSSMGRENRTAVFPVGGVSWNAQYEPFLANLSWLQEAKLRFSAGQTGNSASGAAPYLGAFSSLGHYMGKPALYPVRIQLDNLKWETTTEYNVGLDMGFFDGKLSFTFDWYQKYTKDLLQKDYKVPSSTGYSAIKYFNSGELTNKGWEFRANAVIYENKENDLRISGGLNISRNINELTKIPANITQEQYSFGNGNYAQRIEEGHSIGSFYGYRYKGVYQNADATYARDKNGNVMNDISGNPIVMKNGTATVCPGDAIYEDINHDGVINEYDIVYLGNALPVVTGGGNFNIKWRQLSLAGNLHYRLGQKVVNQARMNNESMYGKDNQSKATLRRWRNEGDITDIPRALYGDGYNFLGSDRFVEDASFLRLKSVTLTYAIPKNACQRWGITNMNVFVTGYNLFTWTDYTGQDPEVSSPKGASGLAADKATTPVSLKFTCGINMNF